MELWRLGDYNVCEQRKILAFSNNLTGHSATRLKQILAQKSSKGAFGEACKRLIALIEVVNVKVVDIAEKMAGMQAGVHPAEIRRGAA